MPPSSKTSRPNTPQGGRDLRTINDCYCFISRAIPVADGWTWSPFRWEIHFKITSLLRSSSLLSMKTFNSLPSHICASHYIIINRRSVSVNLIRAGLPLRGDRATLMDSVKSGFLTWKAWDQTLGRSKFIKGNGAWWEFSEQPARTFKTSLCTVILTCVLLYVYLNRGRSAFSLVQSAFLCSDSNEVFI